MTGLGKGGTGGTEKGWEFAAAGKGGMGRQEKRAEEPLTGAGAEVSPCTAPGNSARPRVPSLRPRPAAGPALAPGQPEGYCNTCNKPRGYSSPPGQALGLLSLPERGTAAPPTIVTAPGAPPTIVTAPVAPPTIVTTPVATPSTVAEPVATPSTVTTPVDSLAPQGVATVSRTRNFFIPFSFSFIFSASSSAQTWPLCPLLPWGVCRGPGRHMPLSSTPRLLSHSPAGNAAQAHPQGWLSTALPGDPSLAQTELSRLPKTS